MGKKGLVWQVVLVVFLLVVIVLPVFAAECSEWVWYYLTVKKEDSNITLHLLLISYGAQHGHSNTTWGRCFYCEDVVSVRYQTPSMDAPANADYECEGDSNFFKIEQTVEEASADFWVTIKGQSAVSLQEYSLKWATNTCNGEVEWFNCQPPTAVKLSYFGARSLFWGLLERILSLFW